MICHCRCAIFPRLIVQMKMSTFILLLPLVMLCNSAQGIYVAEGYFVVDSKARDVYINEQTETDPVIRNQKALEELQKDIVYFLSQVNQMYLTLNQHGLDIEIRVRKLEFLATNVFNDSIIFSGDNVHENQALEAFDAWLERTSAYKSLHYDFANLWTGYDLRGSAAGYSHVGTACSSVKATAVIQYTATYMVAETTAHEIAHVLGANHDGAASTNIMTAIGRASDKNRWQFSSCTATAIIEYMNTLDKNCLESTSLNSTKPNVTPGNYTGHLLNPDVICSRSVNDSASYMCKYSYLYGDASPKGDKVCTNIYCRAPLTDRICKLTFSSDGLICDVGKRCEMGVCQADQSPETRDIDSNCIWGDIKQIQFTEPKFTGNCSAYIDKFELRSCYEPDVNELCCETCKRLSTKVAGCEYGDRNVECSKYPPQNICGIEFNKKTCCDSCKNHIFKSSTNNDQDIVLSSALPAIKVKRHVAATKEEKST